MGQEVAGGTAMSDRCPPRGKIAPYAALWQDVWRLSKNLTAYDACYVALARQWEATLVTRDERIARAPGVGINVEVV